MVFEIKIKYVGNGHILQYLHVHVLDDLTLLNGRLTRISGGISAAFKEYDVREK